jgi:hypothetical protein
LNVALQASRYSGFTQNGDFGRRLTSPASSSRRAHSESTWFLF